MSVRHDKSCVKKKRGHAPRSRCGGTFVCPHCNRLRGWCLGCDDNMPEACDFCWQPPAGEQAQVAQ